MTAAFSRRRLLTHTAGIASFAAVAAIAAPALSLEPKITSFRSTSKSWLWAPEDFAIAKGFFRDENLEVSVVATERAPNIDALLSRAADIVLTPPDQAMRVQMKGQPVRLIAGLVNKYASPCEMFQRDHGGPHTGRAVAYGYSRSTRGLY